MAATTRTGTDSNGRTDCPFGTCHARPRAAQNTRQPAVEPSTEPAICALSLRFAVLWTLAGLRPPTYGAAVTWKPRAERGHWVRPEAVEPRERSHYVPDGTVHAVDSQTGEVACGFDGELIEIEAAWDSPAVASVRCADCEQELARRKRVR